MKNNNTIDLIDCLTNGISEEYIGYTDKQYAKAMKKISKENKKAWAKQHREDKKRNKIKIFSAALKYKKIVIAGKRHHNCYAILSEILLATHHKDCALREVNGKDVIEGFIDVNNKFLTREQAKKRALKIKQIDPTKDARLFSEDLY